MNVTLIVKDKTITYDLVNEKIVDRVNTHACYLYDETPSFEEVQNRILKDLNISGSFDNFVNSINENTILNEEDNLLCFYMIAIFKNKCPGEFLNLLTNLDVPDPFFNKFAKIHSLNFTSFVFASFTEDENVANACSACGDPCRAVYEARFDTIPRPGEVLRYLPIYTEIPDPLFLTGIKEEYRNILHGSHFVDLNGDIIDRNKTVSFLQSVSKEIAEYVNWDVSELKNFSILKPDIDNKAHRQILSKLPEDIFLLEDFDDFDGSIESFFAHKFNCHKNNVAALPCVDDFIKHYLHEYLQYSTCHKKAKYWKSYEGQGKILAATF